MRGRRLPFKRGREESEQIAFFDYCNTKANLDPKYEMIFHVPNGGKMSIQRKISLARAGQKRGVLDIFVDVPVSKFHGLRMELKIKPNRLTREQEAWIYRFNKMGYYAQVVWSAAEAIEVLERYLALK